MTKILIISEIFALVYRGTYNGTYSKVTRVIFSPYIQKLFIVFGTTEFLRLFL